ncbi:MAG: hypothetical protein HQL96_09315 [Magnetococcales bacterium]|nr:hypothetical protein [Magnetococcales bacterium]
MRVTHSLMFKTGAQAMQLQQQDLLKVQEQSVSGQRVNRPSEDPSATYRHMIFSADLSGMQSLKKTTQFATERLALGDSHLGQIHDTLLNAQDLVLQMGESMQDGNPSIMKAQAQLPAAWYQDILRSANTQLDEVPLFGGGKSQLPFDSTSLVATPVRLKSTDKSTLSDAGFAASTTVGTTPTGLPWDVQISYASATNQYTATVNGVAQAAASLNSSNELDLGQGVTFKIVDPPQDGDLFAFTVGTSTQGTPEIQNVFRNATASVTAGTAPSDLPWSVQVKYLAATSQYQVNINGVDRPPTTLDANKQLDLGSGVKFTLSGTARTGDVYYFEVVPKYQGGNEDRPVRVQQGGTLPGNVTGQEFLEGKGQYGRNVNILGAVTALRGALLRADPTEVALQLSRIQEARAQISDLQGVTGVRSAQVNAVNTTLESNEATLTKMKAENVEADVMDVVSQMQQVSQALQVMTATQRQILNNSLIDFIR